VFPSSPEQPGAELYGPRATRAGRGVVPGGPAALPEAVWPAEPTSRPGPEEPRDRPAGPAEDRRGPAVPRGGGEGAEGPGGPRPLRNPRSARQARDGLRAGEAVGGRGEGVRGVDRRARPHVPRGQPGPRGLPGGPWQLPAEGGEVW